MSSSPPRVIDLFCGAGGASCGMWQAGAELVAGVDQNDAALQTHARNLPGEHIQHDLADVDASILPTTDVDWIHGSPPCQGFSQAKGSRDPDDERNQLVWRFVDWIEAIQPTVVTMENVAGMQTISSTFMDRVEGAFQRAGYLAKWRLLNAADFGVPQTRERIFVVAVRDDHPTPSAWFPRPTHAEVATTTLTGERLDAWRTVRDAIGDLADDIPADASLTSQQNEAHQKAGRRPLHSVEEPARTIRCGTPPEVETAVANHEPADHADETRQKMARIPPGESRNSTTECRLHPDQPAFTVSASNATPHIHYRGPVGDAEQLVDEPACTVLGSRPYLLERGHAEHVAERSVRRLTVREAARLQSFDDWFVFQGTKTSQLKQVGNAVPPRLQQHITAHVRTILRGGDA